MEGLGGGLKKGVGPQVNMLQSEQKLFLVLGPVIFFLAK